MASEKSVSKNRSPQKNVPFASVQAGEKQPDDPHQGQGKGTPVIQGRSSNTASLLSAASPPADRVPIIDGSSITTSVTASYPTITTTTTSTATTVTSTTTTAPQQRVTLLSNDGDFVSPAWDHYTECAMLIHGTLLNDTCGTELVRQVGRIPCTTNFYPVDDAFIDGFIEVVKGMFVSEAAIEGLQNEEISWRDYQGRAPSAQQEKMSVWIRLFGYALMAAKALRKEEVQAGQQDPAGKLIKLRNPIDAVRRNLARIHLGDLSGHDTSWVSGAGKASGGPNADPASNQRLRAGSMTALLPLPSPGGGKETLPLLPREKLAGFASKEEALLAWKKKADRQFDKHDVSRSLLRFFERSLGVITNDWPVLHCIAYKFVASIAFAESTRGIGIGEALIEATENELGYVNEILILRERLKAVVRPDSDATPEDKRHCQMWLDFFGQVARMMYFKRDNRETALSDSPDMAKALASCEIAYDALVKAVRQADDFLHEQDADARARQKSERAKERRRKGRSMDFLLPGKAKRAAQPSGTRGADAIGLSPRKKIARDAKPREKVSDEGLTVEMAAGVDGTAMQERERIRKKSPIAESLPGGGHSLTNQPTSPKAVSKPKKKSATFEVAQQEAGPVRAAEKKKAKSRATRAEEEGNIVAPEAEQGSKPKRGSEEKREAKEVRKEKREKTPGKASKGTKED
ncbi:hypothetical protein [Noviherbaspirillum soli]|uniref:hypothetical protein n=1 Tax=Noviherbaspirillum soli TaxID=1064518 RepID=UPI00188CFC68|nr:hypothetical protein [Noviherbaspirillum soli]